MDQEAKQSKKQSKVVKKIGSYTVQTVVGDNEKNGQGEVYLCLSSQKLKVAIKIPQQFDPQKNEPLDQNDQKRLGWFQYQCKITQLLNKLGNRNIVKLIGTGKSKIKFEGRQSLITYPFMVFQFAQKGDLRRFIGQVRINQHKKIFMSQTKIIKIALQLLCGLEEIHQNQLLHLDIKPQNILIFKDNKGYIFKLADFGHSTTLTYFNNNKSNLIGKFGSRYYWPPQVINELKQNNSNPIYGEKSDIYSLGIVILILYVDFQRESRQARQARESRESPQERQARQANEQFLKNFYTLYKLKILQSPNRQKDFWQPLLKKRPNQKLLKTSQLFKQALIGMIHPDPKKRLSIQTIIQILIKAKQQLGEDQEEIDQLPRRRIRLNQESLEVIRTQIPKIVVESASNTETRESSNDTLSKLNYKFKFDFKNLYVSPSNRIHHTQYFGFHPATILAVLSYGLQNYESQEQIEKTYKVEVENAEEGNFKVTCIQKDEYQEESQDYFQGQFVRYDQKDEKGEKVSQKYAILWEYEESDYDKLNYIDRFKDILSIIQDK